MNYIIKNRFSLKWAIFASYIILSLLIGEIQPFTRIPMYSSFPNWAYVFYLKDEKGQIIFPEKKFHPIGTGSLAHIFYSYCNEKGIMYGHGMEKQNELLEVGNYMVLKIKESWPADPEKPKEIFLFRKHLYYDQNKIMTEKDTIIGHVLFTTNN